ncbi:hypothetical protein ACFQ1I_47010 [Kitasatospora arboriphila]
MAAVLEFRTEAKPDHGLIFVYDSDAYLPDNDTAERSRQTVVAGIGPQLYIRSLQGTSPAEIVLRVWDGPVTGGSLGERDAFCPAVLDCPTGTVTIRAFSPEYAGYIELPRPGVYAALVSWRGREAAAEQEASCCAASRSRRAKPTPTTSSPPTPRCSSPTGSTCGGSTSRTSKSTESRHRLAASAGRGLPEASNVAGPAQHEVRARPIF